jgi:hypothetical protein
VNSEPLNLFEDGGDILTLRVAQREGSNNLYLFPQEI